MYFSRAVLLSALAAVAPSITNAATGAAFSYDPNADNGPANWGSLEIDGNACDGTSNSPIAVVRTACDRYEDYKMDNGSCRTNDLTYDLTNTGVKAAYPAESLCENPSVEIPGIPGVYQALQFHIHTSSEHTIDGEFYGAELHTVHAEVGGNRFAVVGMMINPSADETNEMFQALLDGWEAVYQENLMACEGGNATRKMEKRELQPQVFSPYLLLPEGHTFYHYDGGLTTPPCSEVVWWNLADKEVSITPQQFFHLAELVLGYTDGTTCELGTNAGPVGSTSRPVQPLNGRTVERICPTDFVADC